MTRRARIECGSPWWRVVLVLGCLLVAVGAEAQVKNPRAIAFTCPDHATDTGHEVDVIDAKGVVIQTIQGGDPALNAAGEVEIPLNLQPVAFGAYMFRVRATAGAVKSPDSVASEVWERTPGQPGKPVPKGD